MWRQCKKKKRKSRLGSKSSEFWSFVGFDLLPQRRIPSWWHGLFPWVLCKVHLGKLVPKLHCDIEKRSIQQTYSTKHTNIPDGSHFLNSIHNLPDYKICNRVLLLVCHMIWRAKGDYHSSCDIVEIRNNLWESILLKTKIIFQRTLSQEVCFGF